MIYKIILISLSAMLLTACSPKVTTTPTQPPVGAVKVGRADSGETDGATIKISNYTYSPASITVKPGTIIAIVNDDVVGHTVTADNGEFDTGMVSNGKPTSLIAPTTPGRYPYYCAPHPYMVGTIIVE